MPNDSLWIRRSLHGNLVYVRVLPDGALAADAAGLVDVRYKPSAGTKLYRARADNLKVTPECAGDRPTELPPTADPAAEPAAKKPAAGTRPGTAKPAAARPAAPAIPPGADDLMVWTDGACSGNPGPMGIGVVAIIDGQREEVSEYLGVGTNNIAELTAILRGLEVVGKRGPAAMARPVYVHSDSSYAIGLLSQNWKAKANVELVARLREYCRSFPHLHFVKVKGHSGVPENERCDVLATSAVARRQ